MLPFLKNRDDGVGSGPIESVERKPDDDKGFDMIGAVAAAILRGVKSGSESMIKDALEALVDHIRTQDEEQDQSLTGES